MRRAFLVVLLAATTLGVLSTPARAASNAFAGCRLMIAAQDPSLSKDQGNALGGAAMEHLIPARNHITSLRRLLMKKPLSTLLGWCNARYTARQLHALAPGELLAQVERRAGSSP
jgi:hypothetical protein